MGAAAQVGLGIRVGQQRGGAAGEVGQQRVPNTGAATAALRAVGAADASGATPSLLLLLLPPPPPLLLLLPPPPLLLLLPSSLLLLLHRLARLGVGSSPGAAPAGAAAAP